MKYYVTFLLIITLLFSSLGISFATNLTYYRNVFDVYKDRLHPRIVARLPASELAGVNGITFHLDENSKLVTLAGTRPSDKKIVISVGLMNGILNYIECLLLEGQFKANNLDDAYFDYFLNKAFTENSTAPLPASMWFFGNNQAGFNKWINDQRINNARNLMLMSAVINIMVHEYGHHIVGFYKEGDSPSDKIKLEAQVDKWAYNTLNNIGEKPTLGAAISLGYISQLENFKRSHKTMKTLIRTHPFAKERAEWAYGYACDESENNKEIQKACGLIRQTIDDF